MERKTDAERLGELERDHAATKAKLETINLDAINTTLAALNEKVAALEKAKKTKHGEA